MEYKSSNDLSLHYYCESVNDPRASDVTTNDRVRLHLILILMKYFVVEKSHSQDFRKVSNSEADLALLQHSNGALFVNS